MVQAPIRTQGTVSYTHLDVYKRQVFSSLVFPKFSMLDPTLTFTLPEKQVKNGVIDTFVHTTEQYLTYPVEGLSLIHI